MPQPLLKINEIFYSIQGEGRHTGMPAVFVRLSGCSMGCPWCDTKYAQAAATRIRTSACLILLPFPPSVMSARKCCKKRTSLNWWWAKKPTWPTYKTILRTITKKHKFIFNPKATNRRI